MVFRKFVSNKDEKNKSKNERLSLLEICEKLMNEFWYYYIKPKYQVNAKLCYIDTDRFIINVKTEDAYQDIANDVKKWNDTSNYDVNRPLPTGKKTKLLDS